MDEAAYRELRDILGPIAVSRSEGELDAHARDMWPRSTLWVRQGRLFVTPSAVCWPKSTQEIITVVHWANRRRIPLVPFGGGAGVCGGCLAVANCLVVDLKRMDAILGLDEVSRTVTVQPGIVGQDLEDKLNVRGFTLGHFPTSIARSTLGGLLATRSAGQMSSRYGKSEDMVLGLEAVLADARVLRARSQPASAAGPAVHRLLLGSEGTLGFITEATLRLHPLPEFRGFRGILFSDISAGLETIRALLGKGLRPCVARLYDEPATRIAFSELRECAGGCLLILGFEGDREIAQFHSRVALRTCLERGGRDCGEQAGRYWWDHRYDISYWPSQDVRPDGALGEPSVVGTMEVAGHWSRVLALYDGIRDALTPHCAGVVAHISHVSLQGACVCFTFAAQGSDEREVEQRYAKAWAAGMEACLAADGTITHHDGVGLLRASWLAREMGTTAFNFLGEIKALVDPAGIMNPGKLGL